MAYHFTHCKTKGYLPRTSALPDVPKPRPIDKWMEAKVETYCPPFDKGAFGVIAQSLKGLFAGLQLVDRPRDYDQLNDLLSDPIGALAYDDVMALFADKFGTQPIKHWSELEANRLASPGVLLSLLKCTNTGDAIDNHFHKFMEFWNHAHSGVWASCQKLAQKEELIKKSKLETGETRLFNPTEKMLHMSIMRLFGGVHDVMCSRANDPEFPVKVGFVPQQGGFSALMTACAKRKIKFKCDFSKFDKTVHQWYYYMVYDLAYRLWDKTGIDECEWHARAEYYISCVSRQNLLLSTGQVIETERGNPSGWFLTTDLNCLANLFYFCYHYRRLTGKSWRESGDFLALYADDYVASTNLDVIASSEERRKTAVRCGFIFKDEDDHVGTETEGMRFLGMTPKWDEFHQTWVPMFDRNKVLCSVINPPPRCSLNIQLQRVCSLMSLCVFDIEIFKSLRHIADDLVAMGCEFDTDSDPDITFVYNWNFSQVPTMFDCEALWLGYQSSQPMGICTYIGRDPSLYGDSDAIPCDLSHKQRLLKCPFGIWDSIDFALRSGKGISCALARHGITFGFKENHVDYSREDSKSSEEGCEKSQETSKEGGGESCQ